MAPAVKPAKEIRKKWLTGGRIAIARSLHDRALPMLAFGMTGDSILRFDLTDLRLFLTVVEHGSLTRGARAMNLALASASERISGMEAALGARLFERTRRGVRPTPAGEALIRHARQILFNVEQMRGELRSFGRGFKGRIRVLCNTAAMVGFLPPRLCAFLLDHPDLSVDGEELPSVEIALAIAGGRADLGVAADVADLGALQTRPLVEDRLVVMASRKHRLVGQSSVAFSDVAREPLVGVSDAALETHLAERASRLGLTLNYRTRLRRAEDVAMLARAGVGLAVSSEASVADIDRRDLAILPLDDPWARRRLFLCARDFRALSPHAALLADRLAMDGATPLTASH
jgi:DNA-binding transcriptional LysR family regulator